MDDETIKSYDKSASDFLGEHNNADMKRLHEILLRYLPENCNILEIGCGTGRDAAFLSKNGYNVTAADASAEMISIARQTHKNKLHKNNLKFIHESFPLNPYDDFLNKQFDAVISIGTIMHMPDYDMFEFAFQIKKLMKYRGTLIISFSTGRQDIDSQNRDNKGRLHLKRTYSELQLLFERLGFSLIPTHENNDSMGRENPKWITLVFILGSIGERPVDQIEIIINRDKKTATYKLALLRALCEIAQTSYHHAHWHSDGTVSVPLGLIAEKWLYYYWPLFQGDIKQMRGFNKESFRNNLNMLIESFSEGSLDDFHYRFQNRALTDDSCALVCDTIKTIGRTIISGPVKHASQGEFGYIKENNWTGKDPEKLIRNMGRIKFRADVWREMSLLGHWIGEAILLRWAELTNNISHGQTSVSSVLEKLLVKPQPERDVKMARDMYSKLDNITCVWSDKTLTGKRFDVDHVIPFALWHNNNLWNLVPTTPKLNNQKRDRLVSREVLLNSMERIVLCWRKHREAKPERFEREICRSLLGWNRSYINWEKSAFSALREAVETLALQKGIERWEP